MKPSYPSSQLSRKFYVVILTPQVDTAANSLTLAHCTIARSLLSTCEVRGWQASPLCVGSLCGMLAPVFGLHGARRG